jgi:HTH-type transcriptional regulator / antitoxin HipB
MTPIGIVSGTTPITSPEELGGAIRAARRRRRLRLEDIALGAGVGVRFVSELERGKPTVRLAETLRVVASLGLLLVLEDPDDRPNA